MIDIDKLEQAALAANKPESFTINEIIEFTDLSMPPAVLELITRLRAAEKDAKSWEESAQSLATQDNKLIAEMTQQAIKTEESITELEQKIAEQAAVIEKLRGALESCKHGYQGFGQSKQSFDLKLVQEALATSTDSKQVLAEWLDKVLGNPTADVTGLAPAQEETK